MKNRIMRAANALINALLVCDDAEFVDEVCFRISAAEYFEIEEWENDNEVD